MFNMASQPQTIGQTLDNGFKLFFSGFKRCFLLSLLASLVLVLPYVLTEPPSAAGQPSTFNWATLREFILVLLLAWLVYLWLQAAMLFRLGRIARSADPTLTDAVVHGFKCLWPILASVILYAICVFFGLIALIIPGIFLSLSLYLSMPAIVLDGLSPVQALKNSHNLVWGNWWRTSTVFAIPVFLIIIMYMALGFVSGFLIAIGYNLDLGTFQMVMHLFQAAVNALFIPLLYAITIVQYHDLKLRREGGDLEARLTRPAMAY
jgi:hypothetical protein